MSTTVNYDKYRDCDAAIFRGFGTSVSRANTESERFTSFSISFPRAIRHTESSRGSFGHETLAENTVCRPCNAEQADPSPPGVKWKVVRLVERGPRDRVAPCQRQTPRDKFDDPEFFPRHFIQFRVSLEIFWKKWRGEISRFSSNFRAFCFDPS